MSQVVTKLTPTTAIACWLMFATLLSGLAGCGVLPKSDAGAQQPRRGAPDEGPAAVDVAIARTQAVEKDHEYTGTTQPYRRVSLRSQVEGRILTLSVDVGDRVRTGQTVGRLDDQVLTAAVIQAEAEMAARQAEVAQARTFVSDAQTQVEEARLRYQQAQSDQQRLERLFQDGAIAEQQVETARTATATARQAFLSTQQQVRTRQQAITLTQRRVRAQEAALSQQRVRQGYTQLSSPVDGVVLTRVLEPGNLAQPGSEILTIGDFSQVKVVVPVPERELGSLKVGQAVQVRLDAYPQGAIAGRISRISPAADPTARLIPVEVIIPNITGQLGSGLMARVSFAQQMVPRVVIPDSALTTNQDRRSRQAGGQGKPEGRGKPGATAERPGQKPNGADAAPAKSGTVFVVKQAGDQTVVAARQVSLGRRLDGQVEVMAGLQPGDRYVTRSSKALKDEAPVRLSILSEGRSPQGAKPDQPRSQPN